MTSLVRHQRWTGTTTCTRTISNVYFRSTPLYILVKTYVICRRLFTCDDIFLTFADFFFTTGDIFFTRTDNYSTFADIFLQMPTIFRCVDIFLILRHIYYIATYTLHCDIVSILRHIFDIATLFKTYALTCDICC